MGCLAPAKSVPEANLGLFLKHYSDLWPRTFFELEEWLSKCCIITLNSDMHAHASFPQSTGGQGGRVGVN